MVLEAKFDDSTIFKKIIDSFKDSVTQINFVCSESGIEAQAIDDSRVLLVTVSIPPSCFESYRCDRPTTVGVYLASLAKLLKSANSLSSLTLYVADKPDELLLLFEEPKNQKSMEYKLKLVDITADMLEVDSDMKSDVTVEMSSVEFTKTVRDLTQLSDSFTVSVTKDGIVFSVQGDTAQGKVLLQPREDLADESNNLSISMSKTIDLSFASKYLLDIIKAASISNKIFLKFSDDTPALFEFKMEKGGGVGFYLAPKYDDDDENM